MGCNPHIIQCKKGVITIKRARIGWQIFGFVFTAAVGTLLHFLYDWTGKNLLAAPLSAVNESVWEHMKLLYVPLLIFAVIQGRFLTRNYPAFWCGKLISTVAGLVTIPLLYYGYTGVLGVSADWFNITIFYIAAAVAFLLDTHLLKHGLSCRHPKWALAVLLGIGGLFVALTFWPPLLPLFRDPLTGTYGI